MMSRSRARSSTMTGPVMPSRQLTVQVTSQEPDELGLVALGVLDQQLLPGLHLALDELVQRDRAVHDVRLGQAGPFLERLEILPGFPDQSNGDPVGNGRPFCYSRHRDAAAFPGGLAGHVSSHPARSSLSSGKPINHDSSLSRHMIGLFGCGARPLLLHESVVWLRTGPA